MTGTVPDRTSIAAAAVAVLRAASPDDKCQLTAAAASAWRSGALEHRFECAPPDRPGRPDHPQLLPPNRMPKRGKAGSPATRIALLHALAHIELNAIDLAWDLIARFGAGLPRSFVDDWVTVAADEARHFGLLEARLHSLGSHYGALPAHDGLWDAAWETRHDLAARLAVVPLVLEARGLDVTPATVARLEQVGDSASAAVLTTIYTDEIDHVRAGSTWFFRACESEGVNPVERFHAAVTTHFRGSLKPPFNDSARISAGLLPSLYQPLASCPPHRHAIASPGAGNWQRGTGGLEAGHRTGQ